jgi:hypothetical protein
VKSFAQRACRRLTPMNSSAPYEKVSATMRRASRTLLRSLTARLEGRNHRNRFPFRRTILKSIACDEIGRASDASAPRRRSEARRGDPWPPAVGP